MMFSVAVPSNFMTTSAGVEKVEKEVRNMKAICKSMSMIYVGTTSHRS